MSSASTVANNTPLPPGWERRVTEGGRDYFVDHNTKTTSWDHPVASKATNHAQTSYLSPSLPAGWERRLNGIGREYFVDHVKKTTTWQHPLASKATPLPRGWERRVNGEGREYFVSHALKTTTWQRPSQAALPPGWDYKVDPNGRLYFIDHTTQTTAWTAPPEYTAQLTSPLVSDLALLLHSTLHSSRLLDECMIPGCLLPVPTQRLGDGPRNFCSPGHEGLWKRICLLCHQEPKIIDHDFCGQICAAEASSLGPILLQVPKEHVTFSSVEHQFKNSWKHSTVCPSVKFVYKIIGNSMSVNRYNEYRDAVELRGKFLASNRLAGNECRCWHGTTRNCLLGDDGETQFCRSEDCSLCCILKTSFNLKYFKRKTNWGRFGCGIYTSFVSSKSNDYSSNTQQSPYKALILNQVIVGREHKLFESEPTLIAPPLGFDSVAGGVGQSLNYGELVVYTNDAIRPSFLVIYSA